MSGRQEDELSILCTTGEKEDDTLKINAKSRRYGLIFRLTCACSFAIVRGNSKHRDSQAGAGSEPRTSLPFHIRKTTSNQGECAPGMVTTNESSSQYSWLSHPIVRAGTTKTVALLVITLLTGFLLYSNTQSLGWSLFSVLVLLLAVRDYWSPTFYTLTEEGVEVRFWGYTRRKPWHALRSFYPDRNGVLLSPFPTPHRLENFRGVYLRFDDNREEVLAWIQRFVKTPEATA
jgi:hypothetical protein